jgi:hypothetical protein
MPTHYLHLDDTGARLGVWEIDEREAFRIDVGPGRGGIHHFVAADRKDIWTTIRQQAPAWFEPGRECPFYQLELSAGAYHPRMARPTDADPAESPGWYPGEDRALSVIAKARDQLVALTGLLDEICRTVHPEGSNLEVFGHDIRNLLILAATEVEGHWRGILAANGYVLGRATTADYIKLSGPMRLGEYALRLPRYPWLGPFAPFKIWCAERSTKSLPWYHAYNETKHDRDTAFGEASLRNVFEAVCACVIMMLAQFGAGRTLGDSSLLSANYASAEKPAWRPEQVYCNPYSGRGWIATPYGFES